MIADSHKKMHLFKVHFQFFWNIAALSLTVFSRREYVARHILFCISSIFASVIASASNPSISSISALISSVSGIPKHV